MSVMIASQLEHAVATFFVRTDTGLRGSWSFAVTQQGDDTASAMFIALDGKVIERNADQTRLVHRLFGDLCDVVSTMRMPEVPAVVA